MIKILIGCFFSIASLTSFSAVDEKFEKKIYDLMQGIDDLSFSISSNQINSQIQSKLLKNSVDIKANAYWLATKNSIELLSQVKLDDSTKEIVKNMLSKKASIVWGSKFNEWIKNYKEVAASASTISYKDITQQLEDKRIEVKYAGNEIIIEEVKSLGKVNSHYYFSGRAWSQGLLVLDKVKRMETYQKGHEFSELKFQYNEVSSDRWMLTKLIINTKQKTNLNKKDVINRNISEEYTFSHFKINKQAASKYFAKNN